MIYKGEKTIKRTRTNHIGNIARDRLDFNIEIVENLVVLGTKITGI